MDETEFKGGVNNCVWNKERKCANLKVDCNKKIIGGFEFNAKLNCTFTSLGTHLCSGYSNKVKDKNEGA